MKSKLSMTLFVIPLFLALYGFGACKRVASVTNLPAGVTEKQVQNWYTAVGVFGDIAKSNDAALAADKNLHDAGQLPDNVYVILLNGHGRIALLDKSAAEFLESVPKDWSASTQDKIRDYSNQISKQITDINNSGVTNIKNPDTLTKVNKAINDITTGINLVLSLTQALQ